MAGEAEEFGDGDELVATGFELGDYGLHRLDGALVRIVEQEDAAVLDAGEGLGHTILDRHVGPPVLTTEAGDEYLSVHKAGDVGIVRGKRRAEIFRLGTSVNLYQGIGLGDLRKNQRVRNLREIRMGICDVSRKEAEELELNYVTANLKHNNGAERLRIISQEAPCRTAWNVDPTLEDLYLYYFAEVSEHE